MSPTLDTLLALEDRLAAGEYAALLHPEFLEFGQSGRRWTRAEVMAELPPATGPLTRTECQVHALSSSLALLTWRGQRPGRPAAWRSSLWAHDAQHGWRLRFHQATPVPAP